MRTLPQDFVAEIESYNAPWGERLLEALRTTAPSVSLRINPLKAVDVKDFRLPESEPVEWSRTGFYLSERPVFALDPAWHQGRYYVQDSSSMAVEAVVREVVAKYLPEKRTPALLDACAAPGGKTIAAMSALPEGSCVIANEFTPDRARILAENLSKYGSPDLVAVTSCDVARFGIFEEAFDIVIADVPCSGEGMMRKDEQAVAQWSPQLVADCAELQSEIIGKLWSTVRPGGFLIYSTCTFNRHENEDNVAAFASETGAEPIAIEALESMPTVSSGLNLGLPWYRFIPGLVRGEGLFMAVLRKPGNPDATPWKAPRRIPGMQSTPLAAEAARLSGLDTADFAFAPLTGANAGVFAYRKCHSDFLRTAMGLRPLLSGIPVAGVKGRDLAPAPELALSAALSKDTFPSVELDRRAALEYLRGNALADLPDGLPRGYIIACHEGFPMGFAKNIGRRANNLYPDRWRLRLK